MGAKLKLSLTKAQVDMLYRVSSENISSLDYGEDDRRRWRAIERESTKAIEYWKEKRGRE